MIRLVALVALISISAAAQINSPSDEQNPMLSPDGTELYFTIGHHPQNVSGMHDLGDVWVSKMIEGKWSAPTIASGMINNGGYNAVLGFSTDGSEMFLYGHYSYNGTLAGSQGVSVSRRSAGGWSLPKNEEVLYFRNNSVTSGGYITPDKKIFIFSADTRMSHGNEDIYVSFYDEGKWTEPKNIGHIVNSEFQELTPWLSDDKKILYFSSNAQATQGSFDIFSSERLDDSWTNWSAPKNLGSGVNSAGKELYYHPYPSKIFLTSTHNSDGYGDIIEFPGVPIDLSPVLENTQPTSLNQPIASTSSNTETGLLVHGKVLNSANNLGIAAEIVFHASESVPVSASSDGEYKVSLDPLLNYTVRVDAKGFMGSFEKLVAPGKDIHDLEINFKLQPVAVGITMNLKNVLFKQSSPQLLPESFDELEMVLDFLNLNPNIEIELSGHTDNTGKSGLNLKLSRDRVARVKNYLVEKGIDPRRIKGVGYGETKPLASNKTEEGKKLNRRVEFKIIAVK